MQVVCGCSASWCDNNDAKSGAEQMLLQRIVDKYTKSRANDNAAAAHWDNDAESGRDVDTGLGTRSLR